MNSCVIRYEKLQFISDISLTIFEELTAAAFIWFAEEKCQALVIETGLGGTLDATNCMSKCEGLRVDQYGT